MTHTLTRLLLLAALLLFPARPASTRRGASVPEAIERTARVIIVEPTGESYDVALGNRATQATNAAFDWWHTLSPIPTTITIVDTAVVTTSADVYTDLDWLPAQDGDPLTVYVLDNRRSGRLIWGDAVGTASSAFGGFAIVVANRSLEPLIVHELGHALYRLPDQRGACAGDIMCSNGYAYSARIIGCASLARMGAPCKTTYVPVMVRWR